jgi:hypothetical protein
LKFSTMTSKWIKYPALQSPENIVDGTLLDFDIGDWEMVDLTRSYVSFRAAINTTESVGADAIHSVYQSYKNKSPFNNAILVGDYELKNSKLGVVESVQNANIINGNLQAFERDFEDISSDNYKTFAQWKIPTCDTLDQNTPFRRLMKTVDSFPVVNECKVKLGDLSPFCRVCDTYDCSKMGSTRLHLRMDTSPLDTITEYRPYQGMDADGRYAMADVAAPVAGNNTFLTPATNIFDLVTTPEIGLADPVIVTYTNSTPTSTYLATTISAVPTIAANIITYNTTDPFVSAADTATAITIAKVMHPLAQAMVFDDLGADGVNILTTNLYEDEDIVDFKQMYLNKLVCFTRNATAGVAAGRNTTQFLTVTAIASAVLGRPSKVQFTLSANLLASTVIRMYLVQQPALACNNILGAVAAAPTVLVLPNTTVAQCKLWIGQKIKVGYKQAGAGLADGAFVNTKVLTLADAAGPTVNVTLADPLASIAGANNVTSILISCIPCATATLYLNQPQLVLKTLMSSHRKVVSYKNNDTSSIPFSTWNLELANIPTASRSFKRLFECDANTKNVYVLAVIRGSDILAVQNNLASYRMRNNFIDMTNGDIKVFGPLHLDQIRQAFGNSSVLSLKNFYYYSDNRIAAPGNNSVCMPCAILPSDQLNRVEVQLTFSADTVANLTLFFIREVEHVINISGKGVTMM